MLRPYFEKPISQVLQLSSANAILRELNTLISWVSEHDGFVSSDHDLYYAWRKLKPGAAPR